MLTPELRNQMQRSFQYAFWVSRGKPVNMPLDEITIFFNDGLKTILDSKMSS